MKKQLIHIGILLFIDCIFIFNFYFFDKIAGIDIPDLDRQAQWKIDVGEAFTVIIITYLLLKKVVKLFSKK
jgi:hypothetical protein